MRWADMVPADPHEEAAAAVSDARTCAHSMQYTGRLRTGHTALSYWRWAGLMALIWLVGGGE